MLRNCSVVFFLFLFSCFDVHAYIDPGTGSFILQVIMGFLAAASASAVYFWDRIVSFVKSILGQKK